MVTDWESVGVLCQLISLMGLGTSSHPKSLCPEGAESTVDCPGSNMHQGNTGVPEASIGKRGCLGMVPSRVEGSGGPAEMPVQLLYRMTQLHVIEGCLSHLHKAEG